MSRLAEFKSILKFIGIGEPTPEERKELFKEAALMVLARATAADTNIKPVEVELVRTILAEITGEDVSGADIRTAAKSELFERTPLEKYLSGVGKKLDSEQRSTILRRLVQVLKSDEAVTEKETDYFDMVARGLRATSSEAAGLVRADA